MEIIGIIVEITAFLLIGVVFIGYIILYDMIFKPIWKILKRCKYSGVRNNINCFIHGHDFEDGVFEMQPNVYTNGDKCKRCGLIISDGCITISNRKLAGCDMD